MQKTSSTTANASASGNPVPQLPATIKAMVVCLVAAGIAAVIASASLFGLHSYLLKNARQNQPVPPLSTAQVTAQGSALRSFLAKDLSAHPQLGSTQVAARATDVQNYVTKHLPTSNVSSSDISDQASKMHDAVSSSLGGVPGSTLNSTQITNQANSLRKTYVTNLTDLRNGQPQRLTQAQILSDVQSLPKSILIRNLVLFVAMAAVAFFAWRRKYWSRWGVIGLWFLATVGQTFAGMSSILSITVSFPVALKVPLVLAGVLFLLAVILAFVPASGRYYNSLRPAGAQQRRGLFAPRVPPQPRDKTMPSANSRRSTAITGESSGPAAPERAGPDRSKSKQRASADAVAKGAELARTRAKAASKSRRSGS